MLRLGPWRTFRKSTTQTVELCYYILYPPNNSWYQGGWALDLLLKTSKHVAAIFYVAAGVIVSFIIYIEKSRIHVFSSLHAFSKTFISYQITKQNLRESIDISDTCIPKFARV